MDEQMTEEFTKKILESLSADPKLLKGLLEAFGGEAPPEEPQVEHKSYKIDFSKVASFEELLKIMQHLNFVISGPPEYFDQYCQEIKPYLVEVKEEGS